MRGIEHHRRVFAHDCQAAHVGDQVVVAEAEAALAQHELVGRDGFHLGDHVAHFPGRHELAFLDVDRLARHRPFLHEVGLPAQEGRRLDHVDHRGDLVDRRVLVHVGQHRHADLLLDRLHHLQAFVQAGAAIALVRAAVGLVEAAFEDVEDVEFLGDLGDGAGDLDRHLLRFQRVRPRDDEQRLVDADVAATEFHCLSLATAKVRRFYPPRNFAAGSALEALYSADQIGEHRWRSATGCRATRWACAFRRTRRRCAKVA
jgi:hypothetical protein